MTRRYQASNRLRGVTLVEIMAVIAVLAITMAIGLSVIGKAKMKAKEPPCANNLRQIGMALELYRSDANGEYPVFLADLARTNSAVRPAFVCPADSGPGANAFDTGKSRTKTSVYYWNAYPMGFREALETADPNHAVAYCVLHGRPLPTMGADDPRTNTTGVVVRLGADGSVRRAQVGFHCGKLSNGTTLTMRTGWSLLSDAPCTEGAYCDGAFTSCRDPREDP